MNYTIFVERDNTLCIAMDQVRPNMADIDCKSFEEYVEFRKKLDSMGYEKRLELYACEECKKEVAEELKKHKGCKMADYCIVERCK